MELTSILINHKNVRFFLNLLLFLLDRESRENGGTIPCHSLIQYYCRSKIERVEKMVEPSLGLARKCSLAVGEQGASKRDEHVPLQLHKFRCIKNRREQVLPCHSHSIVKNL